MISKKPLFAWVTERDRGSQLLLIGMILATIFFRVFPLEMQKRIVNAAIPFKKLDILLLYSGLYIGSVMLAGVLKFGINVLQGYIGQKILLDMRSQLYDHILSLPLGFFRRTPAGMVISSLTSELGTVGEFAGGALATPLINIFTLVAFAAYMAYLNPLLAFLSLILYPVEVMVIPILQKRFNRLNQTRIDVTRSMSNVIGEAISGMHEIHGNASYQVESRKLLRFTSQLFHIRNRMNAYKFAIKFANNFFQSLGPFTLFLLGGYLTIQGRLDLGALVAFLSAYEKLYDPWKELMDYYQDFQDSRVRYHQVMDYFDLQPEFSLGPPEGREPVHLNGQIDVKDISFTVDGKIRILDQVSLGIHPGEQLALVGLSGSGKSTLAMVIGQLYNYTGGHVLVDGRELKTLTKVDISRNVGYVPQYPFIFDGTLLENLLYGCQSLDAIGHDEAAPKRMPPPDEILQVIDQVGLTEDILRMGMSTSLVHGRHDELSGKLIRTRELFFQRWGLDLADAVDFYDVNRFQYYTSIGENITFGTSNRGGFQPEQLARDAQFRKFLLEVKLMSPLQHFGEEVARQTVSLLKGVQDDAFFFEMSPIPLEEFELFSEIVDRLPGMGRDQLTPWDEQALLSLALRFIPARHKMASLLPALEEQILAARRLFMEWIEKADPGGFMFYRPTEYLYTQDIMDNILFGHAKADYPQATELIRQRVEALLREENLIDAIMAVGLEFQVGSKGDRLSGGQKQKIALARALLKRPPILILDEATASLDNTSQAHIQQLLNAQLRGKLTLISVVHRLELVKDYDGIAVMKAGKIVEMGRYEELMAQKGLFYELALGS